MVIIFELDAKLLGEFEKDASSFLDRVIDISNAPPKVASKLNIQLAGILGVTQKELAVQLIENHIRDLSSEANIEVICLVKEQVQKEPELIDKLRPGRIILLK
ncbi:MAG: hypothetical protein FJ121_05830 [Deltaproteobacteria bacterium]|nr:hypothetical protein [Deltaproteobacteria bacterium]